MNLSNHKSDFVNINGIRLHYLDWGGKGPTLIFLTGTGSSAYIFNKFAPRFTDRLRVLALTRRGHGDSDTPETGYDADTLTEDIRQFMDRLHVKKAVLAGHSLAGVELTHFAATHRTRVEKLIYLEALGDRRGEPAIFEQNPLKQSGVISSRLVVELVKRHQRDLNREEHSRGAGREGKVDKNQKTGWRYRLVCKFIEHRPGSRTAATCLER